jgi:DNA-binding FadR family transcriptional regulator
MRRGKRGGLVLTAPPLERLYDMIGGYCYLIGASRDHVQTARAVLDRVAGYLAAERGAHLEFAPLLDREVMDTPAVGRELRRLLNTAAGNAVVAFYSDCLDQLGSLQPSDVTVSAPAQKSGTLARCTDRLVIAISRGDAHAAAAWASACFKRADSCGREAQVSSIEPRTAMQSHRPGTHAPEGLYRTRAGQIVHTLMRRVGRGQWIDGRILGNQLELCERYGVDRGVLRQAIRILEAAETAASLPGRGRGLVARTPGPAAISRLICCHFAANRVGHHPPFQAFKWLSVEAMALAARQARPENIDAVEGVLAALAERTDTLLLSDLMAIEERQWALAANPVLELFLRSAKAFPAWVMKANLPVPADALRDFLAGSAAVTAAIAARKPTAAAAAQERKFNLLERHIQRFFESFRSGCI